MFGMTREGFAYSMKRYWIGLEWNHWKRRIRVLPNHRAIYI